jgi:uncharacterized glyoxalase superfamily protein PhnB
MPIVAKSIQPYLWFDTEAEAAAKHYVSVFPNAKLGKISRYGKEGKEIHRKEAGSVMTVAFEIEGLKFLALDGGPLFKFTEAVSFQSITSGASSQRAGPKANAAGEGQIRTFLAGGADRIAGIAAAPQCRKGAAGHASDAQDAQARHRRA